MGLDELEPFGFKLVLLCLQELAFVVAGGFELVEHSVQHLAHPIGLSRAEAVGAVGRVDALLDPLGEHR
ncbi:hypothetical protein [Brachybacterium paraconglomeratum]|uniref:hypothetical protein n=1 Tax=Brachybacterium paraconglomeratum TaxID=173362 RepID=UPI00223BE2AD|nr:hypothetical protein [Brachybacterium paraconglomeratum]MCT1437546.1 hypothetical protein [Brachybacterium paraconglomeratum]